MGKSGFDFKCFDELKKHTTSLAGKIDDGKVIDRALTAGAEPIYEQMVNTAPNHMYKKSGKWVTNYGTLRRSLKTNKPSTRGGERKVTIGVHYKDSPADKNTGAYYANPVEFGHGGPAPAPAHSFIAPAYDSRAEEAYKAMLEVLEQEIKL